MYSVVIIDDEKLVISRLALGFDWQDTNFEVIETFQSSLEARTRVPQLKPDLILCDIKMPHLSGLELMSEIHEQLPLTQFIFISGHEDFRFAQTAIRIGSAGYILKPIDDDELAENLKRVEKAFNQRKKHFVHAFDYAIHMRDQDSAQSLKDLLFDSLGLKTPFALAASIGSIGNQFEDNVPFYKWELTGGLYFYAFSDPDQLHSKLVIKQIQKLLFKKTISSFKYVQINQWDALAPALRVLNEEVYSFLLKPAEALDQFEIYLDAKRNLSSFLLSLEQAYHEASLKKYVDTLAKYQDLYPIEQRTVPETVRIYHLTLSLLAKIDGEENTDIHITPQEILMQFESFDKMISNLLERCSECLTAKRDDIFGRQIKNTTLKSILLFINQNFTLQISFNDLSKQFMINPSYLSQLFKRELGITFTQYLTDVRIKYAKELLIGTGFTIAEISEKVGYSQYIYFSKVFKKVVGMSPNAYRKSFSKISLE